MGGVEGESKRESIGNLKLFILMFGTRGKSMAEDNRFLDNIQGGRGSWAGAVVFFMSEIV